MQYDQQQLLMVPHQPYHKHQTCLPNHDAVSYCQPFEPANAFSRHSGAMAELTF